MGRGVVDKPLREVAEFYKDIQSTFLWDNLLVVSVFFILITCFTFKKVYMYVQDARYVRQLSESNTHTDYIGMDKQYQTLLSLNLLFVLA